MDESSELSVHLATDSGLLAIVVPAGLRHRGSDHSWWTREDDLLDEANAGHVVPIETGQPGGFAVRVTFDPPTDRERRLAAQAATFWLRVGDDEEVAVVAGEELAFPDTPGAATFWATAGHYKATVTRIRWTADDDETSEALPDYVVHLRPLRPGEDVPMLDVLPDLSISE